jgi:Lhr-like helicase
MSAPTNPYYQRRFDATGGQIARSRQMVQEFALIQRGFDLIGLQNSVVKYQASASDLVSPLVQRPGVAYFRTTDAFRLVEVRASLLQASDNGAVRVGLIINGFNALFGPLQIDAGQKTSLTSSVRPTIAYQNVPDDSEVLVDILTAGQNAKGLIITLIGVRTGSLPEVL